MYTYMYIYASMIWIFTCLSNIMVLSITWNNAYLLLVDSWRIHQRDALYINGKF